VTCTENWVKFVLVLFEIFEWTDNNITMTITMTDKQRDKQTGRQTVELAKTKLFARVSSFYRSANAIFGKIDRVANKDVVLQLLSCKCMPSLLCDLEACPLVKSDLLSLNLINCFFMKLFKTNNLDIF